jgi:hypothetical protein
VTFFVRKEIHTGVVDRQLYFLQDVFLPLVSDSQEKGKETSEDGES